MGILAVEGSNDRMDDLLAAGKHPIDIILLFAAAEGDVPKIEEIRRRAPTSRHRPRRQNPSHARGAQQPL